MKLIAKNSYLICEPYEIKSENSNGLIMQTNNNDNIVKVIEVSDEYKKSPYEIGDIILYDKNNEISEFMLNGKKYIAIVDYDVIAVIKEEE